MKRLALLIALLPCLALAQTQTTREVDLSWTASTSTQVVSYNVLRAASPAGPFTVIATGITGTASVTYADTTAVIGATYSYEVVAVAPACVIPVPSPPIPCGNSAPSLPVTTPIPQLPASSAAVMVAIQ